MYATWFLIVLPGFIALGDETEIEVMTTRVVSRFPVFVFNASIAIILKINEKWRVVFSESTGNVLKFQECKSNVYSPNLSKKRQERL